MIRQRPIHRTAPLGPPRSFLALVLALVATTACAPPSVELEETQSFRDASHTQTVEAQIGTEVKIVKLSLDLAVDQGTVAFKVRDPLGAVRWQGELSGGGNLSDGREFTASAGPWRLDLVLTAATGHYEVKWLGR